ncbi:MAG: HAMP domain-containing histidine kinase [Alphaproteobacteria bacterium]|nr:HAMP domain-containing histidine kinase [Alphaproteobacteria bacterium]
MRFIKRLRSQRSTDVRVLKAQLDLTSQTVRSTRLSSPFWALAIAWLGSDSFGMFGHVNFNEAVFVPVIVSATMILSASVVSIYQYDTSDSNDYDRTQPWFSRIVAMQAIISGAWGLMPWLLWDSENLVNHVFLAGATAAVLAMLVVSRSSHMDMFLASILPLTTMASARFLFGEGLIDFGIAMVVPMFAGQLLVDGRRLMHRLDEDSRLRFQVEDLARELEETRDDALRKRFEAETANASKTAFLANMSHELRTPLNAILGFSEIIAQECFGPVGSARYKEYAGDIHSSGAHLLSLINDLLDVAKIEAGKMEIAPHPIDAHRTFDIALKLIGAKAREKKQELVITVEPDAPPLYADERALKQILINLVSNAVKFTPEGGKIVVTANAAKGGGFQIMCEDNGPGIPREKLDKIFTPFSQVDNRYDRQAGGTGLGLALVRGLAELHGGRAWLESEYGKGCRAYVVLPAQPPKSAEQSAAAA